MDDSTVPSYLRPLYEDVVQCADPFLISAQQVKSGRREILKFWELRRVLIETLKHDFDEELAFLEELFKCDTRDHFKWGHRRWTVQKFGPDAARKDLESIKTIIREDARNPFAWSHRQWVFQAFGGDWEAELTYCDKIIREDIFNSFAWDQRYFVLSILGGLEAMRDREISYALEAIAMEPGNEYPWTYLRLLYTGDLQSVVIDRRVEDACLTVFKREKEKAEEDDYHALFLDDLIYRRASVHALQMFLDLLRLGLTPRKELLDAIGDLCQSDPFFPDKAPFIVEDARYEVYQAVGRDQAV